MAASSRTLALAKLGGVAMMMAAVVMMSCGGGGGIGGVEAVSCGDVVAAMVPCAGFLTTGAPSPSPSPSDPCCAGVSRVLALGASSRDDRVSICHCLVDAASSYAGPAPIPSAASLLTSSCAVDFPYSITSAPVDCSRIA